MAQTLWFDDERTTTFLVPDDVTIAPGDLWLRTFDGRVLGADRDAIVRYQVDPDVARPYVRAWIEGGYAKARAAFAKGHGGEPAVPDTLEAALGVDPARLTEPETLDRAARNVGQRLNQWLEEEASPEVASSIRKGTATLAGLLATLARSIDEP